MGDGGVGWQARRTASPLRACSPLPGQDYRPGMLYGDIEVEAPRHRHFTDRPDARPHAGPHAPLGAGPAGEALNDGSFQRGGASLRLPARDCLSCWLVGWLLAGQWISRARCMRGFARRRARWRWPRRRRQWAGVWTCRGAAGGPGRRLFALSQDAQRLVLQHDHEGQRSQVCALGRKACARAPSHADASCSGCQRCSAPARARGTKPAAAASANGSQQRGREGGSEQGAVPRLSRPVCNVAAGIAVAMQREQLGEGGEQQGAQGGGGARAITQCN